MRLNKFVPRQILDAVSICLPNDLHAIAVKIAAENGKHIIL